MSKIALLEYKTYREMMKPIKEYLIAQGHDVQVIGDAREIPDRDRFVVTANRGFMGGESFEYPMVDVSHGGMWGKSGEEAFEEYMLGKMNYCVFSNWELGLLERKGVLDKLQSYRVTGRPDMDILYRLEQERVKNDCPVVLYAPTWNWDLNGGYKQIMDTIKFLGKMKLKYGFSLEVAIHPLIEHGLPFQDIMGVVDDVRGVEQEFMPFLSRADILVGDMSSNMLQFSVTGRPMIAYNSFIWWENSEVFDVNNSIYSLRENMYQYTGLPVLEYCLMCALVESPEMRLRRLMVADKMVGSIFDGRCTERIIDYVDDCIKEWDFR